VVPAIPSVWDRTDSVQGDHFLDLTSERADQVHRQPSAIPLQHRVDPHLAPDFTRMVLDLGHDTQPQGFPTITLRKLGRERLGLHSQSLRQWNIRNEEHGYQHKKPRNGFNSRHRDRHRHGPKIRNTDSDTPGWRERFAWQWWKPGHDYSQRDGVDSGTIISHDDLSTNGGTHSMGRHPSLRPGIRLRETISLGQVNGSMRCVVRHRSVLRKIVSHSTSSQLEPAIQTYLTTSYLACRIIFDLLSLPRCIRLAAD
jgi:hypothetical protein